MEDFKEKRIFFQNELAANTNIPEEFNPNEVYNELEKEKLINFAKLIKGTPDEGLIAYKDPKVIELLEYFKAALLTEVSRLNHDTYPIKIYDRFKSYHSSRKKREEWSQRDDRKYSSMPDYYAIRITPSKEPSLFTARNEDPVLQEKINRRELIRRYIEARNQKLYSSPTMTFKEYCKSCKGILIVLSHLFPKEATVRKAYYKSLIETVYEDYEEYTKTVENPDTPIALDKIVKYSHVNIKKLLKKLQLTNPNDVILYKLTKDLVNTLENSELLQGLGISMVPYGDDKTKHKRSTIGYISEFIRINLTINLESRKTIYFTY